MSYLIGGCLSSSSIINDGGLINENIDGTVSVFINNASVLVPFTLNKFCCENLKNSYTFDVESQKCIWGNPNEICLENQIVASLNTNGNDGTLFLVNENEENTLNISFDYLLNVKCEDLLNVLNNNEVDVIEAQMLANVVAQNDLISDELVINETLDNQINILQAQSDNTKYSILCENFPSGAGYVVKNYCLTEPVGLERWGVILGNRFQSFLNAEGNTYNCEDVIELVTLNDLGLLDGDSNVIEYLYECGTAFGAKTNIVNALNVLKGQKLVSDNNLVQLNEELVALQTVINESGLIDGYKTPIDVFEKLDVSLMVEVVTNTNSLETVYTNNFFPLIGSGNLYGYLKNSEQTGFNVCGVNGSNCEPMNLMLNALNAFSCESVKTSLITDLFNESGLTPIIDNGVFYNSLSSKSFNSDWVSHELVIDNQEVIDLIKNKKIKISFKFNNVGCNFSILLDNIVINKVNEKIEKSNFFMNKSPGFNLTRVIDNKKSWVNDVSITDRNFEINKISSLNSIRQTNYKANDDRLIINTKEVDLDINLASAIETDVWGYLLNNPCILSGETNCEPCVDWNKTFQDDECFIFQDDYAYRFMDYINQDNESNCCGDNKIDFNKLLTTNLITVKTVDNFKNVLLSELIDVKNRQTITSYATLRALYDRYLNSLDYCDTVSSKFDYLSMNKFASLIGNYWVDIIEQVIPATTIWGSVVVYTNTIFDEQKFKYKSYSSILCENNFDKSKQIKGIFCKGEDIEVITSVVNSNNNSLNQSMTNTKCDKIYITQMNSGSEFIGSIKIINDNIQ